MFAPWGASQHFFPALYDGGCPGTVERSAGAEKTCAGGLGIGVCRGPGGCGDCGTDGGPALARSSGAAGCAVAADLGPLHVRVNIDPSWSAFSHESCCGAALQHIVITYLREGLALTGTCIASCTWGETPNSIPVVVSL